MQQDLNHRHLALWQHPKLLGYMVAARTNVDAAAIVYSHQLLRLNLDLFYAVKGKLFAGSPKLIKITIGDRQ